MLLMHRPPRERGSFVSSEPVVATKAAEQVAALLRRQIVMGELAEGEFFPPEVEHAAQLGVSRPTLRQAFRILENEQLVQITRGRNGGTRASRPSANTAGRYLNNLLVFQGASLDDVHRARMLIEPNAIAAIAGKASPEMIASLRQSVAHAQEQKTHELADDLGAEFHIRLVELTENRSLLLFARLVAGLLAGSTRRSSGQRGSNLARVPGVDLHDDHSRVVDLIEAGSASAAADLWRAHLDANHKRLRSALDTSAVLDLET